MAEDYQKKKHGYRRLFEARFHVVEAEYPRLSRNRGFGRVFLRRRQSSSACSKPVLYFWVDFWQFDHLTLKNGLSTVVIKPTIS